jgi:hypothetical protein
MLGLRSCHCAKGVVIRNEVAESLALAWENESDMGEVLESLLAVLGESLELEGRPVLLDDVGKCRKMLENVGKCWKHCKLETLCVKC